MPDPIIDQNKIDELEQYIFDDNRTQAYLDLFEITGNNSFLTEAYISSFSEGLGAIAI